MMRSPASMWCPDGLPLNDDRRDHPDNPAQKIRHPRNVRILPASRDFH